MIQVVNCILMVYFRLGLLSGDWLIDWLIYSGADLGKESMLIPGMSQPRSASWYMSKLKDGLEINCFNYKLYFSLEFHSSFVNVCLYFSCMHIVARLLYSYMFIKIIWSRLGSYSWPRLYIKCLYRLIHHTGPFYSHTHHTPSN